MKLSLILSVCFLSGSLLPSLAHGRFPPTGYSWTDDTFADFSQGTLDASGQNIYVSREGKVRTIHHFDLDNNGNLDLIFNNTHDRISFVPPTLLYFGEKKQIIESSLPVEGSLRVLPADLNRDGFTDLIFCPNDSGIVARGYVTILFGGTDGWWSKRVSVSLPVEGAKTLAICDLNADQWPDIAVLNQRGWLWGQPAGEIVRIYWGSNSGYALDRFLDIGVKNAVDLVAQDLDGDQNGDLAVLDKAGRISVYWASTSGEQVKLTPADVSFPVSGEVSKITAADVNRDEKVDLLIGTNANLYIIRAGRERRWEEPWVIEAVKSSHLAVGDLDNDNYPDIVSSYIALSAVSGGGVPSAKAQSGKVQILWGDGRGFSPTQSTSLDVPFASAASVGDLNGDGIKDLAVAVYQTANAFQARSVVFLGTGKREMRRVSQGVLTQGAVDVLIVPAEHTLPPRAIFANSLGGTVAEAVPLQVYWGGAQGFDPKRVWEIPFRSGYEASAADLNADGFVDLITLNSQHAGEAAKGDPFAGANIFWGSAKGFDIDGRRTVLTEISLGSSNVADLDKDGYLDLVFGAFVRDPKTDKVVIRYGSPEGIDHGRRIVLPISGSCIGVQIADFNRDDWLDIAVTSSEANVLRIFWGSAAGFSEERQATLPAYYSISLETADLDNDGYLDLLVSGFEDRVAVRRDLGITIYWGSAKGFHWWKTSWLPGFNIVGITVADFDADGYLDVFAPSYIGELTREAMPSYIYWGGPEGFGPRKRTILITDSASDGMAGDFDHDGLLDLAVSCHSRDGDHHTNSKVFYNDGKRFSAPRIESLPTKGTHFMWDQDVGHIYHRRNEQVYESSIKNWDGGLTAGSLHYQAEIPAKAKLTLQIRSASAPGELPQRQWRAINSNRFAVSREDRCLQYRAIFESDNGDSFPTLDKVSLSLDP